MLELYADAISIALFSELAKLKVSFTSPLLKVIVITCVDFIVFIVIVVQIYSGQLTYANIYGNIFGKYLHTYYI
jgi:hypothetical protein